MFHKNTFCDSVQRTGIFVAVAALSMAAAGCEGPSSAAGAPIEAGTVLQAMTEEGHPVTLRVDEVRVDPGDAEGDVFLYVMSFLDPTDQKYRPFCSPDARGDRYAIPLSGTWDLSRRHTPSADAITFACSGGGLAKCARLGYKPWKTISGVSLADYHQACVYMLAADYCGNGRAHTREGTLIDVWDRLGIQKRASLPDLVLEAAWSPRGAAHISKARYGESLESLTGECPDRLHGRTALDAPGLDEEAILARWPETLLFNDSRVITELP